MRRRRFQVSLLFVLRYAAPIYSGKTKSSFVQCVYIIFMAFSSTIFHSLEPLQFKMARFTLLIF